MGKRNKSTVLKVMLGRKILFQGKFDYGERDRMAATTEAQQGIVADDLDASVDFLVLADVTGNKTIQKKVASLNAKGAVIQVLDTVAFRKMIAPTNEQVLALIRGGKENAGILARAIEAGREGYYRRQNAPAPLYAFTSEIFEGLDLSGFIFDEIAFEHCSFAGITLTGARFDSAKACDFTHAHGELARFDDVEGSRFIKVNLKAAKFNGCISHADFTTAILEETTFRRDFLGTSGRTQLSSPGCVFAGASLRSAKFSDLSLAAPDFDGAELSGSVFDTCHLDGAHFRKAVLQDAMLMGCSLLNADFGGAMCRRANLADANLTGANFDQTDVAECNLRGAKMRGVDLSRAKHYDPNSIPAGSVGPALTALDALVHQARRVQVTFTVRMESSGDEMEVGVDSARMAYGSGLIFPHTFPGARRFGATPNKTFSSAMLELSNMLAHRKVRYETLRIESTRSPTGGRELREMVLSGISEAFAQPIPPAEELAVAAKAFREQTREAGVVNKSRREAAQKIADQQKKTENKQIAQKIAKEVGAVVDIATFLKALELRADKPKIDKATKMLKASGFQLFNDVTDEHLNGIVKSQTDADLVYACRIESTGQYACCTQNLNVCGGLRGSICKHLLVLIIGLVKAGELDPSTIDGWIAKSNAVKSELNKETMGEIFIRYKGAEAGEVDWRPTETVPEDYYSL